MAGTVAGAAGVLGPDAMAEWKLARNDGGSPAVVAGDSDGPAVEFAGTALLGAGALVSRD